MLAYVKFLVRRILCNNGTGGLIRKIFKQAVPDIRWRSYRFYIPRAGVNKTNIAAIFWGFYESAEIRLIHKNLIGNTDVIELGGSIGVVSGHISSMLKPGKRLFAIEANTALIDSIKTNVNNLAASGVKFEILNYAIDYTASSIELFVTDDNTESRVGGAGKNGRAVMINSVTLKEIIEKYNIEKYTLVCDIEGSEVQLLMEDPTAFEKCSGLIIELHEVVYKGIKYSTDDLLNLITNLGFTLVERDGSVCFLKKI